MRLPDRAVLGMKLGYDAEAEADARRQVIDFLAAHGLAPSAPGRGTPELKPFAERT